MSAPRILLLGMGGLPDNRLEVVDFPRLRLWHFARTLLQAGLDVSVVTGVQAPSTLGWQTARLEGLPLHVLEVPKTALEVHSAPTAWAQARRVDAVVSAGPFAPARAVARIPRGLPVWLDIPGDPMAEAQMRSARDSDHSHVLHAWEMLTAVLERGDAFSVISERQRDAVLGQLGLAGRLVPGVHAEHLVHTLPVALEPLWQTWAGGESADSEALPRDPDHVIVPGAVNTWLDVETLVAGVCAAMRQQPRLRVTVTGGAIEGHHPGGWNALKAHVEASGFAHRWTFTGWIDAPRAARLSTTASWGLSLDRPGLEPYLGSRTRLLYGVALGMRFILTPGSALAQALVDEGLAVAIAPGDPESLAVALLEATTRPSIPAQLDARARLLTRFDPKRVSGALVAWALNPCAVPAGVPLHEGLLERVAMLEKQLQAIWRSPTWKTLAPLHRLLKALRAHSK